MLADDTAEVCYGAPPGGSPLDTAVIPAGGTAVIARGVPHTPPTRGAGWVTVPDLGAAQDELDRLAAAGVADRTLTVVAPDVFVVFWR